MEVKNLDWRQAFRDADALPQTATAAQKASRGRMLEKILSAMFKEAHLQPRLSYRPVGEEIDGSIWLDGRTVLVEAKWTGNPHPASSLYQFKGKVDGKLTGTLGIFISIGGFSTHAVDTLVAGKELNIILADGDDIRAIVEGHVSVADALHLKLRAAGDTGTPFLPLEPSIALASSDAVHHLVFVEGPRDVRFLESVRRALNAKSPLKFVPTAGPMNMAPLIRSMLEVGDAVNDITVIVDGDLQDRLIERLRQDLSPLTSERGVSFEVLEVAPDLETALGLSESNSPIMGQKRLRAMTDEQLDALFSSADLSTRAEKDPSLSSVLRAIGVDTSST